MTHHASRQCRQFYLFGSPKEVTLERNSAHAPECFTTRLGRLSPTRGATLCPPAASPKPDRSDDLELVDDDEVDEVR
jgi:hypothetical protein